MQIDPDILITNILLSNLTILLKIFAIYNSHITITTYFNSYSRQQELMNHAKEELDKERKLLQKKRPQLEKESGSKTTKETKLIKCKLKFLAS